MTLSCLPELGVTADGPSCVSSLAAYEVVVREYLFPTWFKHTWLTGSHHLCKTRLLNPIALQKQRTLSFPATERFLLPWSRAFLVVVISVSPLCVFVCVCVCARMYVFVCLPRQK